MAWEAKYPGTCGTCGGRFPEGVRIRPLELSDGYEHEVCPDPLAVDYPPCSRCFLVHPPGACDLG